MFTLIDHTLGPGLGSSYHRERGLQESRQEIPLQTGSQVRRARETRAGFLELQLFLPARRAERNGEWVTWTFQDYYAKVAAAAKSMIRLGLERFHGVCILGFNAPEWFISYLAGIMVSERECVRERELLLTLSLLLFSRRGALGVASMPPTTQVSEYSTPHTPHVTR